MSKININIIPSNNKNKKYAAIIHRPDGKSKKVSFGAKGFSDFTIHKDEQRKDRYIARHKKNDNGELMIMIQPDFGPDGLHGKNQH